MRKALFISLLVLLLMTAAFTSAYAVAGNSISPMASNYRSATARLSLNGGTATASGTLTGINGTTTKATVHLYLQQYRNGEWSDYDDWLESNAGYDCVVVKTVSVPKGYKYRAKASCYAYAGNKSEHVTKYSAEVEY